MKVILLTDVKKVGRRNEVVEVADGYAHNVLIRGKLAIPATPDQLKRIEKEKGKVADTKAFSDTLLAKNIEMVKDKTLTIRARANEKGKLFQTIHPKDIAEALEKEFRVSIPESSIQSDDIKQVGEYTAVVTSGTVKARVIISVTTS